MFQRSFGRRALFAFALLAAAPIGGCSIITAEYLNSGGFVDQLLDKVWFKADTKQMRVLRSYSLIGSLLRLGKVGHSKTERTVLVVQVHDAVEKAAAAFSCAYSETCFFFDDQMAELDQSLFKLAVQLLDTKENEDLFVEVQTRLVGKVPILGDAATATTKMLDAGTATVKAVASFGELGSSLLKVGWKGLNYNRRIGALYRDNLELDMVVTIDSLELYCATTSLRFAGDSKSRKLACEVAVDGRKIYLMGAGNLARWRAFLTDPQAGGHWLPYVIPQKKHFVAVSRLLRTACLNLIEEPKACPTNRFIFGDTEEVDGVGGADVALKYLRDAEAQLMKSPSDATSKFWSGYMVRAKN